MVKSYRIIRSFNASQVLGNYVTGDCILPLSATHRNDDRNEAVLGTLAAGFVKSSDGRQEQWWFGSGAGGDAQSHDANQLFMRIRYKVKYIDLHFAQASWAWETNYTICVYKYLCIYVDLHTYIHTYTYVYIRIHKSSSLTTLDVRWHQPKGHVSHVYWEFPKVFLAWWDISVVSWEGSFWREFPISIGRNDTGLYQIVCFGAVGIEVPPLGCLKQRWWMVVFFHLELAKTF